MSTGKTRRCPVSLFYICLVSQRKHMSCLNSRHLSCLSSRHLSCLNSRHLSRLNRRHLSCLNRRHLAALGSSWGFLAPEFALAWNMELGIRLGLQLKTVRKVLAGAYPPRAVARMSVVNKLPQISVYQWAPEGVISIPNRPKVDPQSPKR